MLIPSENTFARAVELWREWNSRINVISRKDEDNIFAHHILHSLAIARYLEIYYPSCGCIPPSGVRPSGSPHHPFGTVPPLSNRGCYVPQGEHLSGDDRNNKETTASSRINVAEVPEGLPQAEILVDCSKGTYIRALARDLGEALGSGAFLHSLRRTKHGGFTVDEALDMEDLISIFTI